MPRSGARAAISPTPTAWRPPPPSSARGRRHHWSSTPRARPPSPRTATLTGRGSGRHGRGPRSSALTRSTGTGRCGRTPESCCARRCPALWGGMGVAAYSAANRMLDVMAGQTARRGRRCTRRALGTVAGHRHHRRRRDRPGRAVGSARDEARTGGRGQPARLRREIRWCSRPIPDRMRMFLGEQPRRGRAGNRSLARRVDTESISPPRRCATHSAAVLNVARPRRWTSTRHCSTWASTRCWRSTCARSSNG